ncbi:cupin domain-containing protein [Arcticibacter tournemirensis]|uniref:Cupin domain-containing protein n=1 Tax=Arcticibacter tournemirensis TaxID=699437 RepID=A0A4Q0MCD5_9SPHI|nr:cupin domain-containing protein [Arcticibacter tournemirensis]RXF70456.1 cupin domain-containing protein [Arcticibacter tournemirensis]
MNILDNIQLNGEKPAVLTIRNTDQVLILAIGLKKDQVLQRHVTPTQATLIVLKGVVSFEMEDEFTRIAPAETFEIPANVPHEVTAIEESVFLVVKDKVA